MKVRLVVVMTTILFAASSTVMACEGGKHGKAGKKGKGQVSSSSKEATGAQKPASPPVAD